MKQLINFDPFFNPTAKTLDFSQFPEFQSDMLYGVINVTRSQILYAPGTSSYGGTWVGPVLTLTFDTSSYATTDQLNVYYETQPTAGNINTLFNNTALERGGMLEALYIQNMQVLTELRVMNFMLASEFRVKHDDLDRDRKSTRLNSSHTDISRMPSSA